MHPFEDLVNEEFDISWFYQPLVRYRAMKTPNSFTKIYQSAKSIRQNFGDVLDAGAGGYERACINNLTIFVTYVFSP